jgi:hypothetical protein
MIYHFCQTVVGWDALHGDARRPGRQGIKPGDRTVVAKM